MSRRPIIWSLLIVAVTLCAYGPVLDGGFIWDDDDYVTYNPVLQDGGGIVRIWTEPTSLPQWYPGVHTILWFEVHLLGFGAPGLHVVNVLLHAAAALLLWRLLTKLGVRGAPLAGMLFALHPLAVETAAWITEHKNTLSLVFALAAATSWLCWRGLTLDSEEGSGGGRTYAVATLLYCCALMSKSVTCSLPAVLLLIAWWRRGRITRTDVLTTLPWFVLGAAMALVTVMMEKEHVGAEGAAWDLGAGERIMIAGRVIWFYLGKVVLPVALCFNYERWTVDVANPLHWLAPAFALIVPILLWTFRSRIGRAPLTLALIYGGILFPALGFFDVYPMRFSFVADHFAYHAMTAPIILIAAGLTRLGSRCRGGLRAAGIATLALVLGATSFIHCRTFRDMESLWKNTLACNPRSWLAAGNLAGLLLEPEPGGDAPTDSRVREALRFAEMAIEAGPDASHVAWSNRGLALFHLEDLDGAMASFERACRIAPDAPQPWNNIGAIHMEQGRRNEAIAAFEKALRIEPRYDDARGNLAVALAGGGRADEALEALRIVLARKGDRELLLRAARAFVDARDWRHAELLIDRHVAARPDELAARRLGAVAKEGQGERKDALTILISILVLEPGDAEAMTDAIRLAKELGDPAHPTHVTTVTEEAAGPMRSALPSLFLELIESLLEDDRRSEARIALARTRELIRETGRGDLLARLESISSRL